MRKTILFVVLGFTMSLAAQSRNEVYLAYIEKWKETAIQQQADYGIPASITMAQALLESAAGQSELARKAKNHFGIKCTSDWLGGVYYYDAERKNDCFRQYRDAAESFKDHSLFLKRSRYSTCFEIAIEDYEGWAYRLKECGYATDKLYPQKLIRIIETYGLDQLTKQKPSKKGKTKVAENEPNTAPQSQPSQKRPLKAEVVHQTEPIAVIHNDPEPPYVAPLTAKEERDSFMLMHPKHKQNGVTYVNARKGDTYSNVAFRLNVKERDLRVKNDALDRELQEGDRIYLSSKKKQGEIDYVWSRPGLSIWTLSQGEGVTIESIQKINGLDPSVRVFRTRQKIYLRKVKDDGGR